jgi:hypothetical protein
MNTALPSPDFSVFNSQRCKLSICTQLWRLSPGVPVAGATCHASILPNGEALGGLDSSGVMDTVPPPQKKTHTHVRVLDRTPA